jgi:uncharacterized membrane protein YhaH (DUF805 family)
MPQNFWSRLLTFEGRVNRTQYLLSGAVLIVLKYAIDSFVASRFGQPWRISNYFLPPIDISVFGLVGSHSKLYLILWAIAIPFFWIGISLTLRRLRDTGHGAGWLILFFIPVANLLLFLYLSLAPSATLQETTSPTPSGGIAKKTPVPPILGVMIAAALGLALVLLSANFLAQYAWGLFLGVPFITGFLTSWFLNENQLQTRAQTVGACAITPILIGLALIGFRLEGLMCLFMAIPLALPFSIAGGLTAYQFLAGRRRPLTPPRVTACVAIVPLLLFAEHAANFQPPVRPVVTSIVINAPVAVVWKNVIAFPPLAPPTEWIFRTGIAYPIGAVIQGSGVGAVRYCRFSTGDFVEPITVWDENRLLAFSVAAQPPAMHEIGIGNISTPHVDRNYMRSQHGQFRLVALDDRHTLLEGTTWYQDYFWPQIYWRTWSDAIVHRIHTRVLEHVKQQAEANTPQIEPAAEHSER